MDKTLWDRTRRHAALQPEENGTISISEIAADVNGTSGRPWRNVITYLGNQVENHLQATSRDMTNHKSLRVLSTTIAYASAES